MEPEGPASDDARGPLGTARRACDQCRLRKIRCDKRSPCANCRSSKIVCRSTGAGKKQGEPRRRVLISDQYERKIDQIEERLGGIENLLRDLRSTMASGTANTSPSVEITTPSAAGCPSSTGLDQGLPSPAFEGNSSLAAHSAYASKFLETAVSQSALEVSSPKIEAALSTLKEIVNMQDQQPTSRGTAFRHQKAVPTTGLRDLKMPPAQVIVSLLRKFKSNSPSIFHSYFPFMSTDYFAEKCRDVYFATEDYSDATWIIVNGGLFYTFLEYSYMAKANETRSEHQNYLQICQNNLETGLANLNLLMSPIDESIEALTLGAVYAIEISKPSFAWTLISTAAQQCQTLGYHRASSMENDSQEVQENKHRLFWSVYCLDKGLSLRLGRASTIQDYDITSTPTFNRADISNFWKTVYYLWVALSRIQGKVYELLYSPTGLSQPESQRVAYARRLASEMQESVMVPFQNLNSEYNKTEIEVLYLKCDDVSRLSILTLIYRAIPPPPGSRSTFIADCVETARSALEVHQECMIMLKESNEGLKCSYMHWSILYAPFIPFIVIFCHILEVSDRMDPDLPLLSDFVASLQPLCPLSEAIDKLYRLCNVLSTIAGLYVEAKVQSANTHAAAQDQALASMGQEFEGYLTALGLAPGLPAEAGGGFGGGGEVPGPVFGEERTASPQGVGGSLQLGNWFSGNQHMMGLLEEDLEIFKGGYDFLM